MEQQQEKLIQSVASAWHTPRDFPPGIHEAWKIHLRKEWPSLAKAIEAIAGHNPPQDKSPRRSEG